MSKESSLRDEIKMRKATAKSLNEWKDNYDWAVYWIYNFMDAANNLEKMFIGEVGEERYSEILQEFMLNRSDSFYETFDLPVPDRTGCNTNVTAAAVNSSRSSNINQNENTAAGENNIIQFPFAKSK